MPLGCLTRKRQAEGAVGPQGCHEGFCRETRALNRAAYLWLAALAGHVKPPIRRRDIDHQDQSTLSGLKPPNQGRLTRTPSTPCSRHRGGRGHPPARDPETWFIAGGSAGAAVYGPSGFSVGTSPVIRPDQTEAGRASCPGCCGFLVTLVLDSADLRAHKIDTLWRKPVEKDRQR